MIHAPNMLMIGSSSSNMGKTQLACKVIEHFRAAHEIIAIKVTKIDHHDGQCPRGGQGCGVCGKHGDDWCSTEESTLDAAAHPEKDSSRLKAAGATKVLWLRATEEQLPKGAKAVLEGLENAVIVCESNSLRKHVLPGVFFMVHDHHEISFKPSAQKVRSMADLLVFTDGRQHELDLKRLVLEQGHWGFKEDAAAILLTGGKSRRMGQDKSLMLLDGKPMVQHAVERLQPHFQEVLLSVTEPGPYEFLNIPAIPDRIQGQGPLMGLACALEGSSCNRALLVACDMPHLDLPLARQMLHLAKDFDVVIPRDENGKFEPLFAIYSRKCIPFANAALAQGQHRMIHIFPNLKVHHYPVHTSKTAFTNLNSPSDFHNLSHL